MADVGVTALARARILLVTSMGVVVALHAGGIFDTWRWSLVLPPLLVGAGAWVNAQVPPAAALQSTPAAAPVPAVALDARAAIVTDRLSAASGRSLGSLAESVEAPLPAETPEAPTVGSAEEVTERYAETLAQLSEAEAAAAEDLAMTEEEVAAAEKERTRAARELAAEEAAAARQVDAAIDAAIAAAQAESAYQDYVGDLAAGGSIPSGRSTGTTEVLALVRKNFPASQVGNAMAVSRCESGHANRVSQPNTNGSRDFGYAVFGQVTDGMDVVDAIAAVPTGNRGGHQDVPVEAVEIIEVTIDA